MADFLSRNWFIILWLLFGLVVAYGSRWKKWLRKRAAQSWPSAEARIESVAVYKKNFQFWQGDRKKPYVADLGYAFNAEGGLYSGRLEQEFEDEQEAYDFADPLKGQTTIVRYKPGRPDVSIVTDDELARLNKLKHATSSALDKDLPEIFMPAWQRMLLVPLMLLAGTGLALSVFFHVSTFTQHPVLPEPFFFLLHIGAIALGFALFSVVKEIPRGRQMELWKRAAPQWMRVVLYGLIGYAMVNFAIAMFFVTRGSGKQTGPPPPGVWRGFSGHWMVFYAVELASFYCAFRLSAHKRCANGHPVPCEVNVCSTCGLPVG